MKKSKVVWGLIIGAALLFILGTVGAHEVGNISALQFWVQILISTVLILIGLVKVGMGYVLWQIYDELADEIRELKSFFTVR